MAMVMAGGAGLRMGGGVPKQFRIVRGKPVLVYTIEAFQNSAMIDDIVVVIVSDWSGILQKYVDEFSLTKVTKIVCGGSTGYESIANGVDYLGRTYAPNDVVLIHDAVRPLLTEEIINNNIAGVKENGNAITVVPTTEALLYSEDAFSSTKIVDRNVILRTQTPQSLRVGDLVKLHAEARAAGVVDSVATCTLLIEMGKPVFAVKGDGLNFKITTPEDMDLFKAYLKVREKRQRKSK